MPRVSIQVNGRWLAVVRGGQTVHHLQNMQQSAAQPPFPSVSLTAPQGFGLTFPPRFRGSYQHLHYGYLPDALVDLTGGVVTSIDLHSSPSDLVTMVKTAAKAGSLMTCATPAGVSRPGIFRMGPGSPHLVCSATGSFS